MPTIQKEPEGCFIPHWITAISTAVLAIFAIIAACFSLVSIKQQNDAILQQYDYYDSITNPVVYIDGIGIVQVDEDSLFKVAYSLINCGNEPALDIETKVVFSVSESKIPEKNSAPQNDDGNNRVVDAERKNEVITANPDATTVSEEDGIEIIEDQQKIYESIYPNQEKLKLIGQASTKDELKHSLERRNYIHIKLTYKNREKKLAGSSTKVFLCYPHNLTFHEIGEYD